MKRLTTDTPKGCLEGMLNFAIAKDNKVFLADENGEYNVDLCEYVSKLAKAKGYDFSPEDIMEEGLFEYYQEDFAVLYCLAVQATELRERLKFYEDKLENGTLIELPCKVGDTVYRLDTDTGDIEPMVIENMIIDKEDIILRADSYDYVICHLSNIIEKTPYLDCFLVFLTKEEAEARLKKLQNEL